MANALYDKAREAFLKGDIDWLNDTIKVVLVDTDDYPVDLATHGLTATFTHDHQTNE